MIQDILQQIKASKQDLLNNAFLKLLAHPYFQDHYRRIGDGSFDSFCLFFYQKCDKSSPQMWGELITKPVDREYHSPEMYLQIIEERKKIAQNMLQVDYEPPLFGEKNSSIMQLHLMWHLYETGISWPPSIEGMCLDLSFAKLLSAAHRQIAADLTKAEWVEPKNRKSTQTRREKAGKWQSFILAIYEHGKPIAPATRLSKAIEIIQGQFEESKRRPGETRNKPLWEWIPGDIQTPSRDSIINLFKKEGIRERDFEKRGRYWFKKM